MKRLTAYFDEKEEDLLNLLVSMLHNKGLDAFVLDIQGHTIEEMMKDENVRSS